MSMEEKAAREEILGKIRAAVGRRQATPVPPVPASTRVPPRPTGDVNTEITLLLDEIEKLSGQTARLSQKDELNDRLRELVRTENIKAATLWQTPELQALGLPEALTALGVEVVSPHAGKLRLAECDLGVTGVDGALPETGTLVLRSSPERPRMVSLLPRVHLAILRPSALRSDLGPLFTELQGSPYWVFITGPSRTSDIELTSTLGVHGPKSLYVWVLEEGL